MTKRTIAYLTSIAMLLVGLFPPVDRITQYAHITPNEGFKFIGSLAQNERVRISQWLIEFTVVLVIAGILFVTRRPEAK